MRYTREKWELSDNRKWWKTHPFSVTCRKAGVHATTIANLPARRTMSPDEMRDNAMLIAAAPDLYEALWAMVTSFHGLDYLEPHMRESMKRAWDALHKAQGK